MVERRQEERNHDEYRRRNRRAGLIAVLFTVVVLAVTAVLLMRSSYFSLDRLAVEGNAVITEAEISELIPLGENLIQLDVESIRDELGGHPFIAEVEVEKQYPDKLLVRLEERTPACWLGGGELQLLAGDGGVLPRAELAAGGFDLPVLQPAAELPRLEENEVYAEPDLLAACALCSEMQRLSLPLFDYIVEIHLLGDHLAALTTGGERLLLPLEADAVLLTALQAVWSRERLTGVRVLDARFRGQVIARGGDAAPPPPVVVVEEPPVVLIETI